jgi:hypothetical protein
MADRGDLRQLLADMMQAAINAQAGKVCEHATNYKPPSVQTAQLPFVFTQNGRGRYNWTQYGAHSLTEALALDLVILVSEVTLGLRGQAEQAADEYFEIAQDYLGAHRVTTLDGTINTEQIELDLPGDQGLRVIPFSDRQLYGAVINVVIAHERTIEYEGF